MHAPDDHLPPLGFVVALRGMISRPLFPSHREWLIASRWGDKGYYLSVSRTLVRAGEAETAPSNLVPRWSTLALLNMSSLRGRSPSFRFAHRRPSGLSLAGRFAPAFGYVRVESTDIGLRFHGSIYCLLRKPGQELLFEGLQISWVGQFAEPRP